MAWDPTTEHLLVLEWGSENNGVLITVDFSPDDGISSSRPDRETPQSEAWLLQRTSEKLPVVKTFGPQVLNPMAQRLGLKISGGHAC
ncbi:hypothetical protein BOX15_Mlig015987g1 [Macrostomum lignano]|uniref:Uncharacterized protein n=1 Tax=Macrostomum lignano TaxID=282301 RepID=A0A267FPD1_9PLAT|nr:hypothetical protein BOX15_Mlig015987g1 [Macrostomum lignano]